MRTRIVLKILTAKQYEYPGVLDWTTPNVENCSETLSYPSPYLHLPNHSGCEQQAHCLNKLHPQNPRLRPTIAKFQHRSEATVWMRNRKARDDMRNIDIMATQVSAINRRRVNRPRHQQPRYVSERDSIQSNLYRSHWNEEIIQSDECVGSRGLVADSTCQSTFAEPTWVLACGACLGH